MNLFTSELIRLLPIAAAFTAIGMHVADHLAEFADTRARVIQLERRQEAQSRKFDEIAKGLVRIEVMLERRIAPLENGDTEP